ncbi:MAG: hypothetical protein AAB366_00135 [Patescibacteria group bacterium]
MNFLEQLTAEWYSHMGYFVRTNIKYGRRTRGGYEGEMDVIAYHPQSLTLLHIETSMDADSWDKRMIKFKRKFDTANKYYNKLFKFDIKKVEWMVIVGSNPPRKDFFGKVAPVQSIPQFIEKVTDYLSQYHPFTNTIPENYPLLRAILFAIHYDKRIQYLLNKPNKKSKKIIEK